MTRVSLLLLKLHRLTWQPHLPTHVNQQQILHHLIHGDCAHFLQICVPHPVNVPDRTVCYCISYEHSSAISLAMAIEKIITSVSVSQLCTSNLMDIIEATWYNGHFHTRKNLRQHLYFSYAKYLQIYSSTDDKFPPLCCQFDPLYKLFLGFENMNKGSLVVACSHHCIPVSDTEGDMLSTNLWQSIISHIADVCYLSQHHVTVYGDIIESVLAEFFFEELTLQIAMYKTLNDTLSCKILLAILSTKVWLITAMAHLNTSMVCFVHMSRA